MKGLKNKFWQWGLLLANSCCLLNVGFAQAVPEVLVGPSSFKGFNGLNFDATGQLYVTSIIEQTVYRVNVITGEYETFINRPEGQADDFFLKPDGQIFYTATIEGEVRSFNPKTGNFKTIASGIPGVNPIIQNEQSGRVFVAQALNPALKGLYEIDLSGLTSPRLILNQPGLNAFDFGPDGFLYSPLQFTGEIAKINVDTGVIQKVASGLKTPVAVKFNSKGELFAVDIARGEILKINTTTGQSELIVKLQPGLDNIAFGLNDLLYVTNNVDTGITEVNTQTRAVRKVIQSGGLTAPGGIAVHNDNLYVADATSYRILDRKTGRIQKTLGGYAAGIPFPTTVSVNDAHAIISSWFANAVHRLDRNTGDVLNTYTGFAAPYDAVELSDGSILVADCALNQITQILDKSGSNRRIVAGGLSCPTGLAVMDDSTVLVTEYLGNKLSRINLKTGERQVIASNLSSPEGVAYHPHGIAVVADTGTQSLKAINVDTGRSVILKKNLPIGFEGFLSGPKPFIFTGVAIAKDTVYITGDVDNSIRTVKLSN
ncbi:hypothetical protein [Nostoc sp. FACHB-133]|uniref:Vgb family protein n=1 Tax=Nostoc sp. FACHB-133 TaxID=2692835 RepID=UPI00168553D1|nr:hypothetical protein [Nostoc sp. FACHB-133]MBD2527921.1 hypothetical protein [Nostoc sp. FACHB-133]